MRPSRAEYILFRHYLAEPVDSELERKIANYLMRIQGEHGGWPLFQDGAFDMSASVKAYFALKMIGHDIDAPHMKRAREAILARGGAAKVNVFTRFLLTFFGQLTWRSVPVLPIEIMLLPRWSPFTLEKVSYWARTTMVPLMVLAALKPRARNPKGVRVDELFHEDPATVGTPSRAPHQSKGWFALFSGIDAILRVIEPFFPKGLRQRAIDSALAFIAERLNGEDGLGAIYPPMANTVMMYDALGHGEDYPPRAITRRGIDKLLVFNGDEAYCQPCVSPVWDTALTCHALLEAGDEESVAKAQQGLDWLKPLQVLDVKGDWAAKRPDVRPGGWAFQYANAHYPDLDDTAVVVMAMDRVRRADGTTRFDTAIDRGTEWIEGLQSKDGGFAAFDADNLEYYLNNIPFSDHAALLDPPTEDVTARCVSMLAQLGKTVADEPGAQARRRLPAADPDGGRLVVRPLGHELHLWHLVGAVRAERSRRPVIATPPCARRPTGWCGSRTPTAAGARTARATSSTTRPMSRLSSTASQTAWGLLGLMAAGEVDHPAVARGVAYLMKTQNKAGEWDEARYTATGFPRVFYLRYHGYRKFFPLWALARYRNLRNTNSRTVGVGM